MGSGERVGVPETVDGPGVTGAGDRVSVPELGLEKGATRVFEAAGSLVVGLTAERAIGGAGVNGSQDTGAERTQGENTHGGQKRHLRHRAGFESE